MSTSGSFLTSDSGQGGGNFYGRTIFSWSRTDWGRSGNVGYHNVSYNLKTYGGSPSYWQMFFNGSMNVDGTGYGFPSSIKAYGAGATNLSGTYAKTMYTDTAGNRSFGASAQGGIYTAAINTAGSGSWALANIPMYGGISSVSPNSGITDETGTISVGWSKYTGLATLYFRLDQINNADTTYRIRNVTSNPYSWVGWATWVRQTMVNTNSTTLYIYYGDDLDSNGSEDHYNSPVTRPITIANESGQANPTFNDFDYEDTNSSTVAITGSNQILIQGKSTLRVTVDASDAATTNKNANRATYSFSIGGYSNSAPWPASGNVVHNVGTVSDVFGTQNLSVQAIDSRSNSKKVTKSVNVVPYSSPAFVPDLKVRYSNDFDVTDGITVEASSSKIASVSPMTISSVDKNSVNGTSGVRFDLSKGNNSSYSGSWTNIATSFGAGTGDITATLATVASSITTKMNSMTADNTVKWYVKFQITDALETTYYETVIDIGKPIFRIGTDGNVYNNEIRMLNLDDLPDAYAYGDIGAQLTANTYHNLNAFDTNNITVSGSTATIEVEGLYMVHAQQLINCSGAVNYEIRKNNATVAKGWVNNLQTDALASCITYCEVGDTIRVFHDTALSNAWQSLHSSFYIYLLKKA